MPLNYGDLELPLVKDDFTPQNNQLSNTNHGKFDDSPDNSQIIITGRFQPRFCMSFVDIGLPEQLETIKSKNLMDPPEY